MLLFELLYILLCLPFALTVAAIYHPPVFSKTIIQYGPLAIWIALLISSIEFLALVIGFVLNIHFMRGVASLFTLPAVILFGLLPILNLVVARNFKKHERSIRSLLIVSNAIYWTGLLTLIIFMSYALSQAS